MPIGAYLHVDVAADGTGDGTGWALSGAGGAYTLAQLATNVTGDDVVFIKDGSYTLGADMDLSAVDGSVTSPCAWTGVKSTTTNTGANVVYSDWSRLDADRPFINCDAYTLTVGDATVVKNIYLQGADTRTLLTGDSTVVENCKFDNDVGSSQGYYGLYVGNYARIVNCEFLSTNAKGIRTGASCLISYCYFHDMPDATNGYCITTAGVGTVVLFNAFDTCETGIYATNDAAIFCINNTFYNCDQGVSMTTDYGCAYINNIFNDCDTKGIIASTQTDNNFFWKNNYEGNADDNDGVDETTVFKDYEKTTADPTFTNAAGGDFSLQAGSGCLNAGMSIVLGV